MCCAMLLLRDSRVPALTTLPEHSNESLASIRALAVCRSQGAAAFSARSLSRLNPRLSCCRGGDSGI